MSGIVLAIIAVSVIGLICAVVLSVASKFMSVPVDERFGPVRECLPGANCGACGYAGCDSYAQALISGEETEVIEAATRVIGRPWKDSGASQPSIRERTPENRTIASMNPRPEPKEFAID